MTVPVLPERRQLPKLIDNDEGCITVELHGEEIRGWTYDTDHQRRQKMLYAREFMNGWLTARNFIYTGSTEED